MDWYGILELVHAACAIVWVGGGLTLVLAAEIARRKQGPSAVMSVVEIVALLGPPLFVPVSALTVVFGAATAWYGGEFSQLWAIVGLAGFAATFLNGMLMIKPRAEKLAAIAAGKGKDSPDLVPFAENLLMIARFDHLVLALVVADMVLKPTSGDVWQLTAMAVILLVGAAMILLAATRQQPAAA